MENNKDALMSDGFLMLVAAAIIGGFIIFAFVFNFFIPFKKERDFIKLEMAQSLEEDEYRYWKRRLKYLYLRSVPLVGRFFR